MPIYADKKSGRLYIEFQYRGERVKIRLHEGAKRSDAEAMEISAKRDILLRSHGLAKQNEITFERFIAEYFGEVAEHYPKDRFDRAAIIIKALKPFVKGKPMRSIKAADIEKFKAYRMNLPTPHDTPRKPATVEREMSIVSSFFAVAVQNDLIDYNPCAKVKKLRFDNIQDKILRREDEAKFFANMFSEWARDICKMALYTGLRQNDIMRLTRFEVRLDENCIVLTQGKTKRRVTVMLNDVSREILERRIGTNTLLFASPVTGTEKGSVRHAMQRACKRAKIPVITIRDLRRTNVTRKLEAGADIATVARSVGHTGLNMMPRYMRSIEAMQKAADSLVEPVKLRKVK